MNANLSWLLVGRTNPGLTRDENSTQAYAGVTDVMVSTGFGDVICFLGGNFSQAVSPDL